MELTTAQPTEIFAVLGDRVRLRLACLLLVEKGGLCVCELTDIVGESQPNVSRHLKLMKAAGLVEERREGRWVYYRLKDAAHPYFESLRCCIEHVCCCDDIQETLRALRGRLKLRRSGKCVIGFQKLAGKGVRREISRAARPLAVPRVPSGQARGKRARAR